MGKSRYRIIRILLMAFGLLCQATWLISQFPTSLSGLRNKLNEKPLAVSGYFSTQLLTNSVSGKARTTDPFNYRINSGLNVSSYGIKTNLSFHYTDANSVYRFSRPDVQLPSFAFFGISPSYKSITLHAGTRSMDFSRYSLSGHSFNGLGIELKPGSWRISAMYGRLQRAQLQDFNSLQSLDPSLRRIGWGIKAGSEKNGESISVVYFSAYEDEGSGADIPPFVSAAENSILSLIARKKIGTKITLDIDYAFSAFTRDKNQPSIRDSGSFSFFQRLGGLFTPKLSSSFQKALRTTLRFQTNFGQINFSHERVDPEYRTMGALFFNNDFENITAGAQLRSSNQKWMLASNVGYQRNNIQNKENNNASRIILSLQGTWNASARFSMISGFSNYRTTQKLKTRVLPFIEADSIVLALVNQNFHTSINLFTGKKRENNLLAVFQYQKASSIENDLVLEDQCSSNFLSQLSYNHSFSENKWYGYFQFQINKSNGAIADFLTAAPTLGVRKIFMNGRLSSNLSTSIITVYQENARSSTLFQPRLQAQYKPTNRSQLNFYTALLTRQNRLQNTFLREWTSRLEWKIRL